MRVAILLLAALLALPLPAAPAGAQEAPSRPDLEIVAVHVNGTTWNGGYVRDEPFGYNVGIRNLGDAPAENVRLQLLKDDPDWGPSIYNVHEVGTLAPGEVYWTDAHPEDAWNPTDLSIWYFPPGEHTLHFTAGYDGWQYPDYEYVVNDTQAANSYVAFPLRIIENARLDWALYQTSAYSSRATHEALEPFFIDYNGPETHDRTYALGVVCKDSALEIEARVTVDFLDAATESIVLSHAESTQTLPAYSWGCWYAEVAGEGLVVGPYVARMSVTVEEHFPGSVNDPSDDRMAGVSTYTGTPQPDDAPTPTLPSI